MKEEYQVLGMVLRSSDYLEYAKQNLGFETFSSKEVRKLFVEVVSDEGKHGKTSLQAMLDKIDNERERTTLVSSYNGTDGTDLATFERAINVMKRKEKLRRIRQVADMMLQDISNDYQPNDIVEGAFEALLKVGNDTENERPMITADVGAEEFYQAFLERYENPNQLLGIPLHYENENGVRKGFPFVYDYMNGLQGGDLVFVAGKTGTGKTGLGMNISRILAVEHGLRPYYLNTEMDNNQMYNRLVAATAGVSHMEITTSTFTGSPSDKQKKFDLVMQSKDKLAETKLITSVLPTLTSAKIAQLAKQVVSLHGQVDVLIVDYIGRLEMEGKNSNMQSHEIMYQHSKFLKELARKLNIPIIALAQLNDSGELEGAKKMSNEADAVWFWEQIDPKDSAQQKRLHDAGFEPHQVNHTIKIFKNRRGPGQGQYIHFDFVKTHQVINQIEDTRVMK